MYKRIAAIENLSDKNDVEDEMTDRFGDIPVPTRNLIRIAYIRALAGSLKMTEISQRGREVRMKLQDSSALAPRTVMILLNENRRVLQLGSSQPPVFRLRVKGAGPETLEAVQNVLERMSDLQQNDSRG
jgi:transcription-repair coupling factor (superfamily II helicase)